MIAIETKNARIASTMLGIEDHGILSSFIHLEYDGGGQGFGGYSLDTPVKGSYDFKRVGTAWGMEFIRRVLDTLGVNNWEQLPGTHCRVKAEHCKVHAIGHIIKDKWFSPETDLAHLKDCKP